MIRNKKYFPREWKTALTDPIQKRKGHQEAPGNHKANSLLQILGKTAHRLGEWLQHH